MRPVFFADRSELRTWFEEHHEDGGELWVGFYRKDSGKPTVTWAEAVDEALCFGWIDGIRKRVDDISYTNRFTPRRARSNWSAVNIKRARELIELGRMRPAGLRAFEARDEEAAVLSYEQRRTAALDPEQERRFRANRKAWAFFQSQSPSYRRTATHWVVSAKRESTRRSRLDTLIQDSERERRIGPLARPAKPDAS